MYKKYVNLTNHKKQLCLVHASVRTKIRRREIPEVSVVCGLGLLSRTGL